jgi:hypothetical protein
MGNEKRPTGNSLRTELKAATKKPYRKPSFRHEQVFETMALACGKLQPGPTCAGQKKTS